MFCVCNAWMMVVMVW